MARIIHECLHEHGIIKRLINILVVLDDFRLEKLNTVYQQLYNVDVISDIYNTMQYMAEKEQDPTNGH